MSMTSARVNPFFTPSTLPFQAPRFDEIQEADYQPAIEEGMRQQMAEIARIIDNPAPPTFENTLVELEKSGELLHRVMPVFSAITGANTSDFLQQVQEDVAPRLAAHEDGIYLDHRLFERVESIYNQRDTLTLDPESRRLLDWYYNDVFVQKGARLAEPDKAALMALNQEASTLETAFVNKLLAAARAGGLALTDRNALAGMSDAEIAAAERAAQERNLDNTWLIPLQNTTQQPALLALKNREVRKRLFDASYTRTEKGDANDTRGLIARLAQIRASQAKLLGHASYAEWALQDQMARTPGAALKFVRDLVPAATANARAEGDAIQAIIDADGESFQLEPWDWEHYAERVRRARYDLDEEQIKQY
ncbi:MAG TPA: M3 family metallopeptidase, partial [Gemmatimonadaceae bacterium]|nr:M3 family metallopeptidase [Gemmatimonadaceae bacterium]